MLDKQFEKDIRLNITATRQLIVDNNEKIAKLRCAIEKENNKLQRLLKDARANKVALEQRLEALLQVLDTADYPKT